ncbi:MAG: M23 family metallopeptidase [Candidatus Acidiferrales bacterium]
MAPLLLCALCAIGWFFDRGNWIVFAFASALFAFWLAALPWGFWNFYLRYVYLAFFLGGAYHSGRWFFAGIAAFCIVSAERWRRSRPARLWEQEWIDLKFPLAGGTYYVAQGGNSMLLNHHYRVASQKFAVDILKLSRIGGINRKPRTCTRYTTVIYDEPVLSPCDGIVTTAVDGFPDLEIGERDPNHPAGNHVVIRHGDAEIYVGLAHLRNGSVCLRTGDAVLAGQVIGRVGNSGNTSLPHLHIHAKRGGDPSSMLDGEGVPMRFGGRWLVRNSIVRVAAPSAASS